MSAVLETARGLCLSAEMIDRYIEDLESRGRSAGTRELYKRKLQQLYDQLPADKLILPGMLQTLREQMQHAGIPNATINILISAANGLLDYYGKRELQLSEALEKKEASIQELDRTEYLRLLSTARQLERQRPYLLIKVLANTGLYVRELPLLTVEAVTCGHLFIPQRGIVPIVDCLQEELLDYIKQLGIQSGPFFVTGEGKPMSRSAVYIEIRRIAMQAQIMEEKCTPMALRRLYLATQESIYADLVLLAEQNFRQLLASEQHAVGWKN